VGQARAGGRARAPVERGGEQLRVAELADLSETNLFAVNLTGADLTDAIYDDSTAWPAGYDPP
jgi:hypothetical protein